MCVEAVTYSDILVRCCYLWILPNMAILDFVSMFCSECHVDVFIGKPVPETVFHPYAYIGITIPFILSIVPDSIYEISTLDRLLTHVVWYMVGQAYALVIKIYSNLYQYSVVLLT